MSAERGNACLDAPRPVAKSFALLSFTFNKIYPLAIGQCVTLGSVYLKVVVSDYFIFLDTASSMRISMPLQADIRRGIDIKEEALKADAVLQQMQLAHDTVSNQLSFWTDCIHLTGVIGCAHFIYYIGRLWFY
jgi:hypothetical protein